jgi:phage protein D
LTTTGDTSAPSIKLYSAVPKFTVDGREQPSLEDTVLWIEVSEDVRGMRRLEARFENWGAPPGGKAPPGFMFFDGGVVSFGKKIEVAVGAPNAQKTVFSGRVSAVGARFGSASVPQFAILAEDDLQLLRMNRRTRTYEDMSDADVASTLASANGLDAEADAPGPTHKVLVQVAQSDLAFLRERAQAIDAQIWFEDGKLKFKARGDRGGDRVQLTLGKSLDRFDVIADLAQQITTAHAHGYDVSAKSDPDGTGEKGLIAGESTGGKTGADILSQSFGQRIEHVEDRALATSDEASAMAKAEILARGRAFVRCSGETEGTPAMRVGSRLEIDHVGPVFSGTYFATEVTHRFDRLRGFKTSFRAERPAVGEEH